MKIKLLVETLITRVHDVEVEVEPVPGMTLAAVAKDAAKDKLRKELPEDAGWPSDDSRWEIRGYGWDGCPLDADTKFVVVNDDPALGVRSYYTGQRGFVAAAEEPDRICFSYCDAVEVVDPARGDKIVYWPGGTNDDEVPCGGVASS